MTLIDGNHRHYDGDELILFTALDVAIKNGFQYGYINRKHFSETISLGRNSLKGLILYSGENSYDYMSVIFSHRFAKAFWGKRIFMVRSILRSKPIYAWEYHLQKMVTSVEPIKYLGEFL